ncbi:MAG: LPP20 family lipoprotein [Gallionellaceae bacterium]
MPQLAFAVQPNWIAGDSTEFSSNQYLLGRGVGGTLEVASIRARAELASVFEVHIQVVTESDTIVSRIEKNEQLNHVVRQQVSAKTDKVISGISIVKTWQNPLTHDFYALAVLPRAQASASLREEMAKIDVELLRQIQRASECNDQLLKLAALNQAVQMALKWDGFQATLKVVNPEGRGLQPSITQFDVQQRVRKTLNEMRIATEVVEDSGEKEFILLLQAGLASAGFLATNFDVADFVLEGKLVLLDLGQLDGWSWMRATVSVSLLEKETRRVRGSRIWSLKSSAGDAKTARARILMEIEKIFKNQLRVAIVDFSGS